MVERGLRLTVVLAGLAGIGAAIAELSAGADPPVPAARLAAPAPTSPESKSKSRPGDAAPRSRHAAKLGPKTGACREAEYGFTPEREAAAITFVQQHHPELAKLLAVLKKNDESEYCRAIRDLFRTSERLASCREKSPDRYEVELEAWQVKSRIQLLATRLKIAPEDARLRAQLKAALDEQVDLRLRLLAQERKRMAERLERLDQQIESMEAQKQRMAQQQFELLVRDPHHKPSSKKRPNPTPPTDPRAGTLPSPPDAIR
jgi:hypothetical protein